MRRTGLGLLTFVDDNVVTKSKQEHLDGAMGQVFSTTMLWLLPSDAKPASSSIRDRLVSSMIR